MLRDRYRGQVSLLMRILPFVAGQKCFALKGGTAINLFVRDMPRLSVDIDLTYVPVQGRRESLDAMDVAMKRIAVAVRGMLPLGDAVREVVNEEGAVVKVVVRGGGAHIKIEVSAVFRGCVFEPEMRGVSAAVEEVFGYVAMRVLSFSDLYGGKIVAALDRQHPRDLFDMGTLLANEGIDDDLRRAFLVYLLGHNRPMHEIIAVRRKDIGRDLERGFAGMARQPVELDSLLAAREETIETVIGGMPDEHRRLLVSFEKGEPDWSVLGIEHVADLPAIKWRRMNLDKMNRSAREKLVDDLKRALGL